MDDSTILLENPRRRRRRKTTSRRRRKTTSRRRRKTTRRRRRSTTTVVVAANPRRRRRRSSRRRESARRRRTRRNPSLGGAAGKMFGDLTGAVKLAAYGFAGEAVANLVWSKTPLGSMAAKVAPQIASRPGVPQITLSLLFPVIARMVGFRQTKLIRDIARANLVFGAWAATEGIRKQIGSRLGLSDYETVDLYDYDEVPAALMDADYDDEMLLDYETVDPADYGAGIVPAEAY